MNILTVDTDKLNGEINKYVASNNKNPYIICSEETTKLLTAKCRVFGTPEAIEEFYNKGKIGYFHGHRVLIDNKLGLGSVEVR